LNPGILDEEVLAIARQEGRLLLTEDKDFGELVIRMRHEYRELSCYVCQLAHGKLDGSVFNTY